MLFRSDWIHTSKDQGALVRDYTKWDDQPSSVAAFPEAILRARQIAETLPRGPTYVCFDVGLQEQKVETPAKLPDVRRFLPPAPVTPAPKMIADIARRLHEAERPVILMGRVSRDMDDWNARVKLAEALGACVLTDLKTGASFPTAHPLHPVEPRFRPSPAVTDILKQADVVLALDWIDLKGQYVQTLGKDAQIDAKIINVSLDRYSHNGWSMDHYGLPVADLPEGEDGEGDEPVPEGLQAQRRELEERFPTPPIPDRLVADEHHDEHRGDEERHDAHRDRTGCRPHGQATERERPDGTEPPVLALLAQGEHQQEHAARNERGTREVDRSPRTTRAARDEPDRPEDGDQIGRAHV